MFLITISFILKGPRGERGPRGTTGKTGPKVRKIFDFQFLLYKCSFYSLFCLFRVTQEMTAHQDHQERGYVPLRSSLFISLPKGEICLLTRNHSFVFRVCQALRDQQVSQDQKAHPWVWMQTSYTILCTESHNIFSSVVLYSYTHRFVCISQGPAGKDGLPGHPGQRGETVSWHLWICSIWLLCQLYDSAICFCLKHIGIPRQDWPTWSSRCSWTSGESQPLNHPFMLMHVWDQHDPHWLCSFLERKKRIC